jgi:hypothetical protein
MDRVLKPSRLGVRLRGRGMSGNGCVTTTTRRRRRSVNARGRSIGFSRVRFAGVRRAMFARASAIVSSEGFDRSIGSRIDRIAPRGGCATNARAWILFYHGVFSDIWCILKTMFGRLCWFLSVFSDGSRVDEDEIFLDDFGRFRIRVCFSL